MGRRTILSISTDDSERRWLTYAVMSSGRGWTSFGSSICSLDEVLTSLKGERADVLVWASKGRVI